MTREQNHPEIEKKIVVAFDICSSTSIIEDLHKTENIIKWRDFLIWIEDYLHAKSKEYDFNIYKFTGDGWILLFNPDTPGENLVNFIQGFCNQFKARYKRKIEDFLETPPTLSGVNFGIDRGSLIGFIMNRKTEFVGRAINVACRLQGAIKDKDKSPQYKALITKPLYQELRSSFKGLKRTRARRKLRNIAEGNEVHCMKISFETLSERGHR